MIIEMIYVIIFAVIAILAVLSLTKKMSIGIALIGIGTGLGITMVLSDYTNIVMYPITQAIFYSGDWTLAVYLGIAHLASLVFLASVAGYNLFASGGKITWA